MLATKYEDFLGLFYGWYDVTDPYCPRLLLFTGPGKGDGPFECATNWGGRQTVASQRAAIAQPNPLHLNNPYNG
jgi:hypothetical protein